MLYGSVSDHLYMIVNKLTNGEKIYLNFLFG